MGKAIVVTNTDTIASYVTDGVNGCLIDEGDEEKFCQTINLLLENDPKREQMESSARSFVESEMDIHIKTKDLAAFFKRI